MKDQIVGGGHIWQDYIAIRFGWFLYNYPTLPWKWEATKTRIAYVTGRVKCIKLTSQPV